VTSRQREGRRDIYNIKSTIWLNSVGGMVKDGKESVGGDSVCSDDTNDSADALAALSPSRTAPQPIEYLVDPQSHLWIPERE
jgi:hypothetical protein